MDHDAEGTAKTDPNGQSPLKENKEESPVLEQTSLTSKDTIDSSAKNWKGWAELENDPVIFTTIVKEWGVQDIRVDELYDLSMVFEQSPSDTLGLVFLSRYAPPEDTLESHLPSEGKVEQPWFANQISRFSCGTVALMNIIMNSDNIELGPSLTEFRKSTASLSPKACGIELDSHHLFRDIHNSFATQLDRLIVDMALKEDIQAAKQRSRRKKRNKGRKKRKSVFDEDEDDSGFHFVAYLLAQGAVWRLDGLDAEPQKLQDLQNPEVAWTQVAAEDIQRQMLDAQDSGFDFSLMDVTRGKQSSRLEGGIDPQRMREDWAPFIEHMVRLHAERGDLASLLGL